MEEIKGVELWILSQKAPARVSREIPQPVVAHHSAKFSCCGQKPMCHFLAFLDVLNVICVSLKICLYCVVKKSVGVM